MYKTAGGPILKVTQTLFPNDSHAQLIYVGITYVIYMCINVILPRLHNLTVGQDSAMDIVTHYGLDDPGIESW
jgi:hypothetical protein